MNIYMYFVSISLQSAHEFIVVMICIVFIKHTLFVVVDNNLRMVAEEYKPGIAEFNQTFL